MSTLTLNLPPQTSVYAVYVAAHALGLRLHWCCVKQTIVTRPENPKS